MTTPHLSRRTVLALGASGAFAFALAAGALAPWRSRTAEAQMDPVETGTELPPGQYDPSLAGTDPTLAGIDPAAAAPDSGLAVPATPVVTPEAALPEPEWLPTDAGMSTSLGGSDVAVTSEGQSHQIDGPKRKTNKILGKKKRP
jgi:hypothetical protein